MKVIAKNRRANFDYNIESKLIVGIVLRGHEVKSVRSGAISLKESYVTVKDDSLWLINAHIAPYQHASELTAYEPTASRKLLATSREIEALKKAKQDGRTIVPMAIGLVRKFIKLEIGVGRGKKKYDKRQKLKKAADDRAAKRAAEHA